MSKKAVIQFGQKKCKFLTPVPSELNRELSVPYPGYYFSQQYKGGKWNGKYNFINKNNEFPTGLLPLVYAILTKGINPLNTKFKSTIIHKVEIKVHKDDQGVFNTHFLKFYTTVNTINIDTKNSTIVI